MSIIFINLLYFAIREPLIIKNLKQECGENPLKQEILQGIFVWGSCSI